MDEYKKEQNYRNEQNTRKKKKIGRYILFAILLLILAAMVAAVVYFVPLWRTAKDFERELDLAHFSYEVDVELESEGLTREQAAFMQVIARLTGLEPEKVLQIHMKGRVWEDRVYAEVSLSGSEVPLIEVYLSSGEDLINASLFYDTVRSGLVENHAALEGLLPVMAEGTYITINQAEKLSGEDLSIVRDFEPFFAQYDLSAVEYFAALAVLPHLEHEEGSVLALREVKEPTDAEGGKVSLYFEVEHPAQVVERNVEKYEKILSMLKLNIDGSSFRALKRLAVTLSSNGIEEIALPENVITQEQFDAVQEVRKLFEDIADLIQNSPPGFWDLIGKFLEVDEQSQN